ncbi:MAG: biotin--[acetyl-CoA-carboxylase] ligase [Chloroflexi bacterium]|nr:biotin--[acetyl-CoA-carboxylase] ligase [Chloroflexota bacterium]
MPPLGQPLIRFDSIPSTQEWARGWAELGAAEGLTIHARSQTQGHGRQQRIWWSPPGGGLYLSLLLRPAIPLAQASHITMLAALAAIDTCTALAAVQPRPKWPNDVLLNGRKLAGILSEQSLQGDHLRYVIVGIGLNVNTDFRHTDLADIATSLRSVSGRSYDIERLRHSFLDALNHRYQQWQSGISPYHAWRRQLEPVGRMVSVQRPGQPELIGKAIDATPEGALQVRDAHGHTHTIWSGDVVVQKHPPHP